MRNLCSVSWGRHGMQQLCFFVPSVNKLLKNNGVAVDFIRNDAHVMSL